MNAWLPIVGPILAFASAIIVTVIVSRKGTKSDAIVAEAGIATRETNSIGQVLEGLKTIGDSLRMDNADLRLEVAALRAKRENGVLRTENEALKLENEELRARVIAAENPDGP